jgi:hypothetical protein
MPPAEWLQRLWRAQAGRACRRGTGAGRCDRSGAVTLKSAPGHRRRAVKMSAAGGRAASSASAATRCSWTPLPAPHESGDRRAASAGEKSACGRRPACDAHAQRCDRDPRSRPALETKMPPGAVTSDPRRISMQAAVEAPRSSPK